MSNDGPATLTPGSKEAGLADRRGDSPDLPPAFVYRVQGSEGVAYYRDLDAVRRHVQHHPGARVEIVWHRS